MEKNKYFSLKDTIYNIFKKYPEAYDFFIQNGFDQLKNKKMVETMGRVVTLDMALTTKKINKEEFVSKLISFLEKDEEIDISLIDEKEVKDADVLVEGVLPCPIRIPLLESIKQWVDDHNNTQNYTFEYNLKSANLGLDWVVEKVKTGDENEIPDVLISAGYELFFDKNLIGQFMEKNVFDTYLGEINKDFFNEEINLSDPKNRYSIVGVVPALFLVNIKALGDRKIPNTWADLLNEEYEDSIALPMNDLDLFNALMITIYKEFGYEGIKKLARSYKKSLHPSQMVKEKGSSGNAPAISIIPYFFSQMVGNAPDLKVVWPTDGALLSPIFMLTKKNNKEKIKPFVDFFMNKEIGEIFSSNGKFPSTNPNVNNQLEDYQNFKWVGWDFIHSNDVGQLVRDCENYFDECVRND